MNTVVRMKFGSHLYGTDTPQSDVDYKSVFIPDAADILLCRVKGSIQTKRPKQEGEKNFAGELDEESFSLQRYLGLLSEGQTVSLDMLFAPEEMWEAQSSTWKEIVANRHRLLTKKSAAFVGYCRQQANKYGIRGSRVAAARASAELFAALVEKYGAHAKVQAAETELIEFAALHEHCSIVDLETARDGRTMRHFECCGKKLPWSIRLQSGLEMYGRAYNDYGHRARLAESNESIDWKALSHAVRVANEALELMATGHITFPLPNREHILDIKLGRLDYKIVSAEIEELLERIEAGEKTSILPDEVDRKWIDDFVLKYHRWSIIRG